MRDSISRRENSEALKEVIPNYNILTNLLEQQMKSIVENFLLEENEEEEHEEESW